MVEYTGDNINLQELLDRAALHARATEQHEEGGRDDEDSNTYNEQAVDSEASLMDFVRTEGNHFLWGPGWTFSTTASWKIRKYTAFVLADALFRGFGQVMFMNNPFSGLVILLAILWSSPYQAGMMCIGGVSSTLLAMMLSLDKTSLADGLYGYNGALVGVGLATFHYDESHWVDMPQIVCAVIVVSGLSTLLQAAFSKPLAALSSGILAFLLGAKLGSQLRSMRLQTYTFPFNLALWIWLGGAPFYGYFPINGNLLQPSLLTNPTQVPDFATVAYDWEQIGKSIFRGVSQVFLQNNTLSGGLIVLGMSICAPLSAFWAVFGSVVSTATALGLGVAADSNRLYAGLYAYNGVLAAIAMGKVPSQTLLFIVFGAVLSTALTAATAAVFAPAGLPVGTFPFVLASWLMHMTSHAVVEARQTRSVDAFRPFSPHAQIRAVERVRIQAKIHSETDV